MSERLPPVGSIVKWRRSRYLVVAHGCATTMAKCPNAPHSITVRRITAEYEQTECLNALECTIEEPERVRTYDVHGEPHDDVLRTRTGKIVTEDDIARWAEQAERSFDEATE